MQGSRITTMEALARQQRRQILLRAYQTALVFLAGTFLVLMTQVSKPQGYVASVTVRGEGVGSSTAALDQWLRTSEVLQTAYRNVKERSASGWLRAELPHEDMAAFRQRIGITTLSQNEEAPILAIEFSGPSSSLALQGAEELSCLVELDYEVFQHAKRISLFDQQLKELSGKLSQVQLARQECSQLVERVRYNEIARAMQTAQSRSKESETAENSENNLNPRWKQTREKLDQLVVSRAQLLSKLLPNHPQVEQLDLQISFLQQQMKSIPKTLLRGETQEANENNHRRAVESDEDRAAQSQQVSPPPFNRASFKLPQDESAIRPVANESPWPTADSVDVDLPTALHNLARLGQEERQTQLEIDTLRRQAVSQVTQCIWSSSAPKILRKQAASGLTLQQALLSVCGGLAFGGAFLASTFWSRDGKLLWSISQAQSMLKLPVIAMLHPAAEGEAVSTDLPTFPKSLVFGSALIVGSVLLALIATAIVEPGIYFELTQAPLETLVQATCRWVPTL